MLALPIAASAYEKSDMIVKFSAASANTESTSNDIGQIDSLIKVVSKAL